MTLISIACNHPDNGFFMHRFTALHYGNDQKDAGEPESDL